MKDALAMAAPDHKTVTALSVNVNKVALIRMIMAEDSTRVAGVLKSLIERASVSNMQA